MVIVSPYIKMNTYIWVYNLNRDKVDILDRWSVYGLRGSWGHGSHHTSFITGQYTGNGLRFSEPYTMEWTIFPETSTQISILGGIPFWQGLIDLSGLE